jgi:D-amino-acid dehydrogenase
VKVLVLGAGVVGTTTAYFLAEDGHQVTVLDRQPAPGLETSFANGAQISACHAKPWAGPSVPAQAFLWMFQPDAPLLFRPWRWDPALWSWGMKFLRNCTDVRLARNMQRTLRVALYSRAVLKALRQKTNIQYDQITQGILHIYRSADAFADGRKTAAQLEAFGLPQSILTPNECVRLEPALAHIAKTDLKGGLLSPEDESGDAHRFTTEVAKLARARGVIFRDGVTLQRIDATDGSIARVITDKGPEDADAFVLALGSYSPHFARPLGLRLPVYPAKGYSISIEIENPSAAPTISLTDETNYMVFSRLGNRMRVAGTAELAGWNTGLDPARVAPLVHNARDLFPDAASYTSVNPWAGLRPATPDSVPILGATSYPNLFLNTGHGTLGWTMACGSARIIADLIAGRTPEIDMEGLGLDRFGAS